MSIVLWGAIAAATTLHYKKQGATRAACSFRPPAYLVVILAQPMHVMIRVRKVEKHQKNSVSQAFLDLHIVKCIPFPLSS